MPDLRPLPDRRPLEEELDVATRLAREAAVEILRVKDRARAGAKEKPKGQGPVTEADLAADALLCGGLREAFPHDLVITEETWCGEAIPLAHRVWFCDPLDGTQEFVRGGDDYAVMIGLCVGGTPALGVLCQPATGRLWRGVVYGPTRLCERVEPNGEVVTLDLRRRRIPKTGPRAAISRSHPSKLTNLLVERLGARPIKKGSVGLKIGLLVDGEADLYLSGSRNIKVWDTAGPEAVLRAAGGLLTSLAGHPLRYSGAAAHGDGLAAFSPAAKRALGAKVEALLEERRRQRSP